MELGANCVRTSSASPASEEDMDLRRGPWTVDEDFLLINHIATHGEGRWNSLARSAGLKRTGKSCRLRWLNYLRPDVRRGNITPEEQLLILELHTRWGNRWSKIAQHLPGRTDNEIKNYWRTRVQKHAKQLKCDVNSKKFKDVMRYVWMPRLQERIRAANSGGMAAAAAHQGLADQGDRDQAAMAGNRLGCVDPSSESSSGAVLPLESPVGTQVSSPSTTAAAGEDRGGEEIQGVEFSECWSEPLVSPGGYSNLGLPDYDWWQGGDLTDGLWNLEDDWLM